MKPYYSDDSVTLYHADALDILSALCEEMTQVDAVLTDPPYASGARTEVAKASSGAMLRGVRWAAKPIENDQMTTLGFIWLIREIAYRARFLLPDGGSFCSFIDWRSYPNLAAALETVNLRLCGMVVWDKKSYGLGNGFRRQHELMIHAAKGVPNVYDHGFGDVLSHGRDTVTDHPSPKPVPLLRDILKVTTPRGGTVLDPFAGAGAIGIAARDLGMKSILIECEEKHCETAALRFSQSLLPVGEIEPEVVA